MDNERMGYCRAFMCQDKAHDSSGLCSYHLLGAPPKESPHIPALDKPAEGFEKFLENIATAKHCPVCPDQGWFPYETGGCDSDGENDTRECVQRQCEWCYATPDGLFNRLGEAMAAHASIVKPLREKAEKHTELIMAVGNKYEGETRHETALRYIRSAENQSHGPVSFSQEGSK